jgi:hypothetical protein
MIIFQKNEICKLFNKVLPIVTFVEIESYEIPIIILNLLILFWKMRENNRYFIKFLKFTN